MSGYCADCQVVWFWGLAGSFCVAGKILAGVMCVI